MKREERFKLIPSVYLILEKEGKILLSRRFQTGYEDGKYSMVAGHADGGETLREALRREVQEEAGIRLDLSKLELVLTMHRWCGDHERADFFFKADVWEGEIKNMEPDKCDDLKWFLPTELPENIVPYIRTAIECYVSGTRYAEFGWEEKNYAR
ncbi:MAG: NUDIX domain-containing protein [Candidatus Moranbacteria bacterium]|nr:NUDIX domain-containing protein [Candidatus Moranbacteria bacterium]